MASNIIRRMAHTFKGAPKVNYFPHLSKRNTDRDRVSQDRGNFFNEQGRDKSASQFRSSLSDPEYTLGRQAPPSVTGPTKVVPAEGATPFATPEYDPVRNSLMEPDYMNQQP